MNVQEVAPPSGIEKALAKVLPQVREYLELEEAGFNPADLKYTFYFVADGSEAFMVFEYITDDGPAFAFFQYCLAPSRQRPSCIGCWPRTEGQTIAWSLAEYLQMNPPDGV
jgi:hypothetical protein